MTTTLTAVLAPTALDERWAAVPPAERQSVDRWIIAIRKAGGIMKPISACAAKVAAIMSVPPKTARNKIDALVQAGGDWYALVDKRKLDASITEPKNHVGNPDFQRHLKTLIEDNKLSTSQAIEELKRQWRAKEEIPGYEGHPGWPCYPTGWSERNLYRVQPTKDILISARIGSQAAARYMPQVRTTRVNLYPGAIYFFDDVWHDNYVRVGLKSVTRVIELGVMDAFSACRFHLGAKPRMPKDDGSGNAGIKKREMLWFLMEVLTRFGYSARGTELRAEHGTAAISETTEQILHRLTGGLVTVQRSGIIGVQQPLLGDFWRGRGKGNPRAKAPLESFHHLLHNALGALPGQTGAGRNTAPENVGIPTLGLSTDPGAIARRIQTFLNSGHKLPMVPYQQALLEAASIMAPEVQSMIIHPLMEFFSEFYPAAQAINHALNCRTKHELEGWEELGFKTIEYFDPEAGQWLLPNDLTGLTQDRFARISACARTSPTAFTRPCRLSPHQVWETRTDMLRLDPLAAAEILGAELSEPRKVAGSYFTFMDGDVSPVPLVFKAEITTPDGRVVPLHHGQTFETYLNPYDPSYLIVLDSKLRPMGLAPRDFKVDQGDREALARAYAEKSHRTAARLQDYRQRHEGEARAVGAMRSHNVDAMVKGTPEDRAAARSASAQQGQRTAAANRMQDLAPATDWDTAQTSSQPSAFDDLPDDDELPPAF